MSKKENAEERKRKKKRLLREHVYVSIKGAIIGGEFEPGRRHRDLSSRGCGRKVWQGHCRLSSR